MQWTQGGYTVDTDPARLSVDVIHSLIQRSYWAPDRSRELVEKSLQHSLCFGLYFQDQQVGLARVVTDYTTFFWLCDVFIDEAHRGKGLGKFLIKCVVEYPELKGQKGFLATRDAHGLYEKFGFAVPEDPRRFMERPRKI